MLPLWKTIDYTMYSGHNARKELDIMEIKIGYASRYLNRKGCGFSLVNLNPKGKKTSDCVIRAIALVSGKKYEEVRDDAYAIYCKTGYAMSDKKNEERLLEKYGFVKMKQPRKADNTKYLVGEIWKLTDGRPCVVSCAHHLTAYNGNDIVDLWDCRNKTIGNYYIKEK